MNLYKLHFGVSGKQPLLKSKMMLAEFTEINQLKINTVQWRLLDIIATER